jgi:hypothetical protein
VPGELTAQPRSWLAAPDRPLTPRHPTNTPSAVKRSFVQRSPSRESGRSPTGSRKPDVGRSGADVNQRKVDVARQQVVEDTRWRCPPRKDGSPSAAVARVAERHKPMRCVRIRWPLEERAQTHLLHASAVTQNLADCEYWTDVHPAVTVTVRRSRPATV